MELSEEEEEEEEVWRAKIKTCITVVPQEELNGPAIVC